MNEQKTKTEMGMDGMFFARIDFEDYHYRKHAKELEFVWRGSDSLGTILLLF